MLSEIRDNLQKNVSNSQLTLNQNNSGSIEVGNLLSYIGADTGIQLSEVTFNSESNGFSIQGVGNFWLLEHCTIKVQFSQLTPNDDKSEVCVHIVATLSSEWSFETSFPNLPRSLGDDVSIIQRLMTQDVKFSLFRLNNDIQLALAFKASADGPLKFLKLFNTNEVIDFSGEVSLKGNCPEINVSTVTNTQVNLGTVSFGTSELSLRLGTDKKYSDLSELMFSTSIAFTPEFSINLIGELNPGIDVVRMRLDGDNSLTLPSLRSFLLPLIGTIDDDLASKLEPILEFEKLKIDRLMIDLHTDPLELDSISIRFGKPDLIWPIKLPGTQQALITLENVEFELQIDSPFIINSSHFSILLFGKASLFDSTFEASIEFPQLSGSIQLLDGSIKFSQIIETNQFFPDNFPPNGLPKTDFSLSDMRMAMDMPTESFFIESKLSENLTIPIPGLKQSLIIQQPELRVRSFFRDPGRFNDCLCGCCRDCRKTGQSEIDSISKITRVFSFSQTYFNN